MHRRWKKRLTGAISIFLTIIFVSNYALIGLLVDSGRLRMARAVAEGALDNAGASVLSYYNRMLYDLYGLFATDSLTEEDITRLLGDYAEKTLGTVPVEESALTSLVDAVTSAVGGLTGEDGEELPTFDLYSFDAEITLVDGASHTLANTEAVEAQIIDHMKYRAPENLFNAATSGDSFLGKLQGLFDLTERMSVTKDKLELTGGKEALFRSASDMITKIGNFNANVAAFAANPADPYQYLRELDERFTEIGNEYEIEPEETPAQTTEGDASSTQTSESEPSVTQENGGSKRDEQIEAARTQYEEAAGHTGDAYASLYSQALSLYQQANTLRDETTTLVANYESYISQLQAKLDEDPDNENYKTVYLPEIEQAQATCGEMLKNIDLVLMSRTYTDNISDDIGREFYNNVFNYNDVQSADSMRVMKLDNKFFIRLQPWSSEGVVSKLDVGVGDVLRTYFDSTSVRPQNHTENSFYIYAGAEGQLRNSFFWDAKAKYTLLGHDFGDFEISANGRYNFYPFRRERKSPVSVGVHFESTLLEPTWYQQHINANHFKWDNEFGKISNTSVLGTVDIPRWRLNARVGYALLANNIWYDNEGIVRQNEQAMSVLNASLRKEFVLGPLHLDNKLLFQLSSNQDVLPLPKLALNLKYYLQFVVQRDETKTNNIMVMQIGANAFYNTPWHSPAWNPNLGVFHNQTENLYTNGPYFVSADRYIVTKNGMEGLKLGIYWPFYAQPRGYASPPGSVR